MTQSENIGLNIFEQADKLSMGAFNSNWQLLDNLLRDKARVAVGSYTGQKANQADSFTDQDHKTMSTSFGLPVSSTVDKVVAQVEFRPKVFLLMASRSEAYAWTGVLFSDDKKVTKSKSGQERQSVFLLCVDGAELCQTAFSQRGPRIGSVSGIGSGAFSDFEDWQKYPVFVNSYYWEYADLGYKQNTIYNPWLPVTSQVVIGGTEGAYTVTVKGGSTALGTENLADIGGLTYHWVALG